MTSWTSHFPVDPKHLVLGTSRLPHIDVVHVVFYVTMEVLVSGNAQQMVKIWEERSSQLLGGSRDHGSLYASCQSAHLSPPGSQTTDTDAL